MPFYSPWVFPGTWKYNLILVWDIDLGFPPFLVIAERESGDSGITSPRIPGSAGFVRLSHIILAVLRILKVHLKRSPHKYRVFNLEISLSIPKIFFFVYIIVYYIEILHVYFERRLRIFNFQLNLYLFCVCYKIIEKFQVNNAWMKPISI